MFRYRCPQCSQLLQALEMRAGKTTVCSKCSRPLTIPADRAEWLDERGQPLANTAPASGVIPVNGPSSNVLSADAVRRPPKLPSFSPLDDFGDMHAPIVIGDDEVNLTPPEVMPPTPPPQPLAPPVPRKVYEAHLPPAMRTSPVPPAPTPPAPVPIPPPTPVVEAPPPPPVIEAPAATPPAPPPVPPPSQNGTKRPELDWNDTPAQPPRRPSRVVATTPAPPPRTPAPPRTPPVRAANAPPRGGNWPDDDTDAVSLSSPMKLRSQMDIAAELSMVLSTRMKPAPEPPRDLKPSTAIWLLLTGLGIALLVLAMVTPTDYQRWAGFVGAIQIAAGYVWIVWLAFRREWQRGIACAVPPVTFYYLFQKKYARFRPLRFVLTGAALVGIASLATKAQTQTREWTGARPAAVVEPPPDLSKQSKLVQLREYREQRLYSQMMLVLKSLAGTDHDFSKEAGQRTELAAELNGLCTHPISGVKVEALAAYVRWALDEADARKVCLAALRSADDQERMMAIRLLPKWKDTPDASGIASSIAARLGRPSLETTCARDALVEIGGQAAEQAVIPVLEADEQSTRIVAIDLLEKVGGPNAVDALLDERKLLLHQDPATHKRALAKAATLKARLGVKK